MKRIRINRQKILKFKVLVILIFQAQSMLIKMKILDQKLLLI